MLAAIVALLGLSGAATPATAKAAAAPAARSAAAARAARAARAAPAPRPHWARSWKSLRATAAKVKAVKSEFVQKKRMPLLSRPLVSKGRFSFHHRGHLRWEYRSPLRSLLEMKNGRVRRYVWENGRFKPDARQRPDAMQVVLTEISLWLAGRFQASENFKAKLKTGAKPRVILTPKKTALTRFIERIELVPSRQPGAVERVIIHEAGQATTTLEFTSCRVQYR